MRALTRPAPAETPELGRNLRYLRLVRGLSLARVSAAAGIPQSTLSKVENGQMSLNFEKLLSVAQALEVDVARLFAADGHVDPAPPSGRRAIDRRSDELRTTDQYRFRYLCTELKRRKMIPAYVEVGTAEEAADPQRPGHVRMVEVIGERFAYVIRGPVEFHSEFYETTQLDTGDSVYIDAGMPHAFVSAPGVRAEVLWVMTSEDDEYLELALRATTHGEASVTPRLKRLRKRSTTAAKRVR